MAEQESTLLAAARLRIRKTSEDVLDRDIEERIDFVMHDLKRIGVRDEYLDTPHALVRAAVLVYVQANFGTYDENLMKSYDMILTKIKGSRLVRSDSLE